MPATEVLKVDEAEDYGNLIRRAAAVLREDGLVGFPTETVYGVGARADRRSAIDRLRALKGRDELKPFTVHIGDPGQVGDFVPAMSAMARRFVRKAWPGPVTLVFSVDHPEEAEVIRSTGLDRIELLYHEGTIGIRCPDDPIARNLLDEAGVPVVAASANRAGRHPPRDAAGVLAELDGGLDLLLDGGETRYAQPSTVVKLHANGYDVLREGVIDERTLRRFGLLNILFVCSGNTCRSPMAAALCRTMLAKHLDCGADELGDRGMQVTSAGVFCMGGSPASDGARRAMKRREIDLTDHASQPLDVGLINQADHVFCMTQSHQEGVTALVPSAASKTHMLGGTEEIADPFGGSVEVYEACAARIEAALISRLAELDV